MRIDIHTIIAVLSLAAALHPCLSQTHQFPYGQKSHRRSGTRRENKLSDWSFPRSAAFEESESGRPWLTHRDHMMLLKQEGGDEGNAVECCPSRLDMIEPDGGKTQDDMYVELYRDGETRQRFYELSCREDVFNKPCRFLDRKLYNQSRCVQKYSYTYALVRDPSYGDKPRHQHHRIGGHHRRDRKDGEEPEVSAADGEEEERHERGSIVSKEWKMDYIRVRSGCSCEVLPKLKKKRNQKVKKSHRSRKLHFEFEADET